MIPKKITMLSFKWPQKWEQNYARDGRKEGGNEWGSLVRLGLCFSHDTKALLCNQLCVKLVLCARHNGAQRQGAGGPVGSARTQLWTEPAQPRSIWALITSVVVWPWLPQVRHTMRALSKSFVVTFKALFSQNLKYFIRPPSPAPILQVYYEEANCALPWNPFLWRSTKDFFKSVWVLMQSCCSSDIPLFKFQTVKKGAKLTFISFMCSCQPFISWIYMDDLNQAVT